MSRGQNYQVLLIYSFMFHLHYVNVPYKLFKIISTYAQILDNEWKCVK